MSQDTFRLMNCFFQLGLSISMNDDDKNEMKKLEFLLQPMESFTKYYQPSPAVCFDEIMISFLGRFKFLVYCPSYLICKAKS